MARDVVAARSENPFSLAFWVGSVDPRPLALARIGIGLAVLHDLVDLTRDFRAFLTDDGMLPRGTVHDVFTWSLFDLVGSPVAVGVLYVLGVVARSPWATRRAPPPSPRGYFWRRSTTAISTSPTVATSSFAS
jgi:hypothetical protein